MNTYDNHSGLYWNNKCECDKCRKWRLDLHLKISRGASALDKAAPGWHEKVNLSRLTLDTAPSVAHLAMGHQHMLIQILGSSDVSCPCEAFKILIGGDFFKKGVELGLCPQFHDWPAMNPAWTGLILRRHVD